MQDRHLLPKKSGWYSTTDVITALPQLRWVNEGFHAGSGKKRVTYNEFTSPMDRGALDDRKPNTRPSVVETGIYAGHIRSLPWTAVRSA